MGWTPGMWPGLATGATHSGTRHLLFIAQPQEATMNTQEHPATRTGMARINANSTANVSAFGKGGARHDNAARRQPEVTDLVGRLVTVPGLVRPGVSSWDMKTRLPL